MSELTLFDFEVDTKKQKVVHRAYKYRIYPNATQRNKIHRSFGASRWVYNHFVAKQEKNNMYFVVQELVNNGTLPENNWNTRLKKDSFGNRIPSSFFDKYRESTYLTQVKKHENTSWLSDVHNTVLESTMSDIDNGFNRYYKGKGGKPKFKNRNSRKSISMRYGSGARDPKVTLDIEYSKESSYRWEKNAILFDENKVKIPGLNVVRADVHRRPQCHRVLDVTVSQDPDLKYYASFTTEEVVEYSENNKAVGLDLGITHLVITSDGDKYHGAKSSQKYKDKLAKEQRKLHKMVHGSSNYQKQKIVVAKIHKKIQNERRHEINVLVHKLCTEYGIICIEDLSTKELQKRSKSGMNYLLVDMSWHYFKTRLEQKCNEFGCELVVINKWYASSQICSTCGHQDGKKELDVRFWQCSACGECHDRDINASINIKNEGLRVLRG